MMSAVVDNDGYMTVEQDHCSTYLITKQQITSSSSDISLPGTSVENVTEAAGNTVETPQTGDMEVTGGMDSPRTGDTNSMVAVIAAVSICSAGVLLYMLSKGKKQR